MVQVDRLHGEQHPNDDGGEGSVLRCYRSAVVKSCSILGGSQVRTTVEK
jgi:hypothetical protein